VRFHIQVEFNYSIIHIMTKGLHYGSISFICYPRIATMAAFTCPSYQTLKAVLC